MRPGGGLMICLPLSLTSAVGLIHEQEADKKILDVFRAAAAKGGAVGRGKVVPVQSLLQHTPPTDRATLHRSNNPKENGMMTTSNPCREFTFGVASCRPSLRRSERGDEVDLGELS